MLHIAECVSFRYVVLVWFGFTRMIVLDVALLCFAFHRLGAICLIAFLGFVRFGIAAFCVDSRTSRLMWRIGFG